MGKKVAVIHTSFVSVEDLKKLFNELVPEVKMINIIDDSLLDEVMSSGGLTEGVTKRICSYAVTAESMGVDAILNQCSSVGEAVDTARKMIKIPYVKIDEPMAEEAVRIGGRISVIATVATTMNPSVRLIEHMAEKKNKKVEIKKHLVDGALDILLKEGNRKKHNDMVLDTINKAAEESDVIVLAQGSMIILLPHLTHIKVPILSSLRSGVLQLRQVLNL
ncbi:MAG: aspartate/glutamate racemase family protein [Clostridia bacterium]